MIINELGAFLVSIAIAVLLMYVLRWVLSIDQHLKQQRVIISLLAKLSSQQGVSKDDLGKILEALKEKK